MLTPTATPRTAGRPRIIAVGLDGFEPSIAAALMARGKLPMLQRLQRDAALFSLDHGPARETGLAWEHFATGQDPDRYRRWSAVTFDSRRYRATQEPTRSRTFLADVDARVVAFDVPYLDLAAAARVKGMANWGAHDPGVGAHAQPSGLAAEILARFGPYPAKPYIYGFVWPCPQRSAAMGEALAEAVRTRAAITSWLLRERYPDFDLGITVIGELHSAAEALWHGWDADHPLHGLPSAAPAASGIEAVYVATDGFLAQLAAEHPDATLLAFSMHGMGPNHSDTASMMLLPELLYRRRFGAALFQPRDDWTLPCPQLRPNEEWACAIHRQIRPRSIRHLYRHLQAAGQRVLGRLQGRLRGPGHNARSLAWMPASRYQSYWRDMDAFALPAFYDGQIRINLAGREVAGTVSRSRYPELLDELEAWLRQAIDPVTGAEAVAAIERPLADDPFSDHATRCDLKITWRGHLCALKLPGQGLVGPVPQRRTGGHTGKCGYAALFSPSITAGDYGHASAFDVAPTLLSLLGEPLPQDLCGSPLRPMPSSA